MSNTTFEWQGAEQIQEKLKQLNKPAKARTIARKAARQAMIIVRDAAKANAKMVDDNVTKEKVWKNIAIAPKKSRDKDTIIMRVGVKGGASYSNPSPSLGSGGDTRYWRFVELGTSHAGAKPFMRPAMDRNVIKVEREFAQVFNDELDKLLSTP